MSIYKDNTRAKMLKDLEIEDIIKGYTKEYNHYVCIFCGECFEEGIIYTFRNRMITAEKAASEHVLDEHSGSFSGLISLDKEINGLSDVYKNLLENMFKENDNKQISKNLNISEATVRTHKFNMQKKKREAKIFLAIMELIENEQLVETRNRNTLETSNIKDDKTKPDVSDKLNDGVQDFSGNTLHPFFTLFEYK